MSGEIEAAGDAITGVIVARAVEPGQDAIGRDGHTHESVCLNCATRLEGPFCSNCGQAAHLHRSLAGLWHDIAHGVFHFEGKVWHTLPMLAWNPGALTRRYIHGERARFVSPLALFLFSVFLMFAVFQSVGGPLGGNVVPADIAANGPDFKREQQKNEANIARLERERSDAVKAGKPVAAIDTRLKDARSDREGLRTAEQLITGKDRGVDVSQLGVSTGSPEQDRHVREALKNPKLLLYKLQNSAYKFAWALIPLSLPFMWLMFAWRPRFKIYDHAVFVTYSLSAVMLLLVAMALMVAVGASMDWALFLIPAHFFVQLKGAYSLGNLSAAWRTFMLLIFAPVALMIFALTLLLLGLLG